MKMVSIVDTGGANHASIQNALHRLGQPSRVITTAAEVAASTALILPGVGHAGFAMHKLRAAGLVEPLREFRGPVLGICLGLQLLFSSSSEGDVECLGLLPGRVEKLEPAEGRRVPHMGWNQLSVVRPSALLADVPTDAHFYFVHSYRVPNGAWVEAHTRESDALPAVVAERNFLATQFHPERSGAMGALLLKNFLRLGNQ